MLKKYRYVTAITAIALLLLNACDDGGPCHSSAPVAMPTEIAWNGLQAYSKDVRKVGVTEC